LASISPIASLKLAAKERVSVVFFADDGELMLARAATAQQKDGAVDATDD
jgi:hypothetical protein